jgi:Ca2+-transporting ATPase
MAKNDYAYHQWSLKDLETNFSVDIARGLSRDRAATLLEKFGPNSLEGMKTASVFKILLRQFANFFILLLLGAAVLSYFVDGPIQCVVLLVIIFVNVILGFAQEYKAATALADLKKNFQPLARVIRDNVLEQIDSRFVVPGDIVMLEAGDKAPVDGRVIEESALRADEAALSGESLPVGKNNKVLALDTPLSDRRNMVYASTTIVAGRGKIIAVATGQNTAFGQIAKLVTKQEDKTPLEKEVDYLAKLFMKIALLLSGMVFLLGYFRHLDLLELLTFTIALLVAVVPESLPTAITMTLAAGVTRMAKKKAIVRKMSVIEGLGMTDIIATDKTGTLTNNNLIVDQVSLYLQGDFKDYYLRDDEKLKNIDVDKFFGHGLACSNIDLNTDKKYLGDPVEIAIAEGADRCDNFVYFNAKSFSRLLEIPFDSDKKFMAVMVQSKEGKSLIAKGMAEKIVEFCDLSKHQKTEVLAKARELSRAGYKVIALADKHLGTLRSSVLSSMKFRGFFAMADEPSKGVRKALAMTIQAGIRPIMMTGDHPETAKFVAERLGLKVTEAEIISGDELEKMDEVSLRKALLKVKIFARVTPFHKIRIVEALQKSGFSVAVTGDGVNDAPALKEAQVGIAMGIRGTDTARDAADIVLVDDKYETIVSAIAYGRAIYDNIRNTIVFLLAANLGEIGLVVLAFLFGLPVPFTTLQILWVNLVTDAFPAISLSFEKPSKDIMLEKPRSSKAKSLNDAVFYALALAVSSLFVLLGLYLWGLNFSIAKAQTMAFCFVVLLELIFAFSIRSKKRFWESPKEFFANKYLLLSMLVALLLQALLFWPPLSKIFGVVPLRGGEILALVVFSILTFFVAEFIRAWHDKRLAKRDKDS